MAVFGVAASVLCAFFLIGLDITARDALHERWYGRGFVWKMGTLIAAGSVISAALSLLAPALFRPLMEAGSISSAEFGERSTRVAAASFIAFAGANVVDSAVYQLLHRRTRLLKINGSNVVTSLADSILFPTLAFGALMPAIIVLEFAAKASGGFVWSLVLRKRAFSAA